MANDREHLVQITVLNWGKALRTRVAVNTYLASTHRNIMRSFAIKFQGGTTLGVSETMGCFFVHPKISEVPELDHSTTQ